MKWCIYQVMYLPGTPPVPNCRGGVDSDFRIFLPTMRIDWQIDGLTDYSLSELSGYPMANQQRMFTKARNEKYLKFATIQLYMNKMYTSFKIYYKNTVVYKYNSSLFFDK